MTEVHQFFNSHPFLFMICYMVSGLMGMFVHFLKLEITGNTLSDMLGYFSNNFRYTLYALITTTMFGIGAWWMEQGITAAFMAGYAFDSLLNRETGNIKSPNPIRNKNTTTVIINNSNKNIVDESD